MMNLQYGLSAFEKDGSLCITNISALDLRVTLDCGQSFRWQQTSESQTSASFSAAVGSRIGNVTQTFCADGTSELRIEGQSMDDLPFWIHYFDLGRDYVSICSNLENDRWLKESVTEFPGIRILNQDPFETLISFIISQNNNIPRIKGIIGRLCETFGEPLNDEYFSFPDPEKLASLTVDDLAPLRAGFRNKYILDAADKVASGEIDLNALRTVSLDEAAAKLMTIKGVGPKVAQCVCLYGLEHADAFPVDVWVRRIMSELYPDGLPECAAGCEGIAQQFLFHWRRCSERFR